MRENNERRVCLQHTTDEEIASAIRYLDPNPNGKGSEDGTNAFLVICIGLTVLGIGVFAYFWLGLRVP
jgi:hypothetical protein